LCATDSSCATEVRANPLIKRVAKKDLSDFIFQVKIRAKR
jgi:hypothetical protein